MYDDVLLPTDGGRDMDAIVEHATELAGEVDATLHALHVVDNRAYASIPDDVQERVRETLEGDAEDATKAVAERAFEADIPVVREVRWGNPAAGILSYAIENDVDLILMGTHGRTGYDRYLMGSVAEKVVRAAPVPVLTVNVGDGRAGEDDVPDITVGEYNSS